jgi:hypothetical protein
MQYSKVCTHSFPLLYRTTSLTFKIGTYHIWDVDLVERENPTAAKAMADAAPAGATG